MDDDHDDDDEQIFKKILKNQFLILITIIFAFKAFRLGL